MAADVSAESVASAAEGLEDLWSCLDTLFGDLHGDDWQGAHGDDWTFADVPYHLSYFDGEIIADALEYGPDMPAERQQVWPDFAALSAWNARHFAARADLPAEAAVEAMLSSRERVRSLVRGLSDGDLDAPAFTPVFGGWLTTRAILQAATGHTWNHATELRLRLGRSEPEPSAVATHRALSFYGWLVPHITLDRERAREESLTTVMQFTGDGGGAWTIRAGDGTCSCIEGAAEDAELTMTQSPSTYHSLLIGMTSATEAMQSGALTIEGAEHLGRYAALFPGIDPSRPIPPAGSPTLG